MGGVNVYATTGEDRVVASDVEPFGVVDWLELINLALTGLMTISIGFTLSLLRKTTHEVTAMGTTIGLLLSFYSSNMVFKRVNASVVLRNQPGQRIAYAT